MKPDLQGQIEGYARGEQLLHDLGKLMQRSHGLEHYYLEAAYASLSSRLIYQDQYIREARYEAERAKGGISAAAVCLAGNPTEEGRPCGDPLCVCAPSRLSRALATGLWMTATRAEQHIETCADGCSLCGGGRK